MKELKTVAGWIDRLYMINLICNADKVLFKLNQPQPYIVSLQGLNLHFKLLLVVHHQHCVH